MSFLESLYKRTYVLYNEGKNVCSFIQRNQVMTNERKNNFSH